MILNISYTKYIKCKKNLFYPGKQRQLAGKMRELSSEIHRIKTEGEGKALADTQEELAEVKEIKDKVTHDLEKAKKVSTSDKDCFCCLCNRLYG